MLFILAFLVCFLILLPACHYPEMQEAKNRHLPNLYVVRKNGFTCLDSGDTSRKKVIRLHIHNCFRITGSSSNIQSKNVAPRMTIALLHARSCIKVPALMWAYAGKSPADSISKKSTDMPKNVSQNFQNRVCKMERELERKWMTVTFYSRLRKQETIRSTTEWNTHRRGL